MSSLQETIARLRRRLAEMKRPKLPAPTPAPAPPPAPAPTPTPVPTPVGGWIAATEPNRDDGKPIMQLNLYALRYWNLERPFLNEAHQVGAWTAVNNQTGATMDYAALWAAGYINKATTLPNAVPPGFDFLRTGLFRFSAVYDAASNGATWAVDWTGDADMRFWLTSTTNISANRIEHAFPSNDANYFGVEVTRVGAGGFGNFRVYRKTQESLLNGGEIFDPAWVTHASKYKVLRPMDVQNAADSQARSADHLAVPGQILMGAEGKLGSNADAPRAASLETCFDMAIKCSSALWLNVGGFLGTGSDFESVWLDGGAIRTYVRTNADVILSSPEHARYYDKIVSVAVAKSWPTTRMLYIEPLLEHWNFANPWYRYHNFCLGIYDWLNAQSPIPNDVNGISYCYGYFVAHQAKKMMEALQRAGRSQAYKIVAGSQAVSPGITLSILRGMQRYWTDNNLTPSDYNGEKLAIGVTSYFADEVFTRGANGFIQADSDAEHLAAWQSAIAGNVNLARDVADFVIQQARPTNVPSVISARATHRSHCSTHGGNCQVIDYEGAGHDTAPAYLGTNATFRTWYEDTWIPGSDRGRIVTAMIDGILAADPNTVISKYLSVGALGALGRRGDGQPQYPWFTGLYDGQSTGVSQALAPYLRA